MCSEDVCLFQDKTSALLWNNKISKTITNWTNSVHTTEVIFFCNSLLMYSVSKYVQAYLTLFLLFPGFIPAFCFVMYCILFVVVYKCTYIVFGILCLHNSFHDKILYLLTFWVILTSENVISLFSCSVSYFYCIYHLFSSICRDCKGCLLSSVFFFSFHYYIIIDIVNHFETVCFSYLFPH